MPSCGSRVNSNRKEWGKFADRLEKSIDEIRNDIKEIFKILGPAVDTSGSPRRLTEFGLTISQQIGAKKLAAGLARQIKDEVEGFSPYDVQEYCFEYMKKDGVLDEKQNALVRDCAYENGVKVSGVLRVIALELRDEILRNRS